MATVTNPTRYSLWCAPLGEEIDPEGVAYTSNAIAEQVSGTVFVVELDQAPVVTKAPAKKAAAAKKASLEPAEVPSDDEA